MHPPELPVTKTFAYQVTGRDSAVAFESGSVPVLATPKVLALFEKGTCLVIDGHLDQDETSVGHTVQLDHLAPSFIGDDLEISATLVEYSRRRCVFECSLISNRTQVARATISRVVVKRSDFLREHE